MTPVRAPGPTRDWTQRLRTLREQQHDLLVGVVCSQAATVLGHPSPNDIDPECAFRRPGV